MLAVDLCGDDEEDREVEVPLLRPVENEDALAPSVALLAAVAEACGWRGVGEAAAADAARLCDARAAGEEEESP